MSKFSVTRAALLCCGVSALALPALASAQTSASDAPAENDIIVTATRSATNLQDTPMAIDVVSGSDIRKLNIFDVKEIQNLSPGLELTNTTGRNNTATLRGVAFDPDGGTSPAVEVFFNEIPINANTAFTAIYDIGQVEVLRGPQGLFRGRTSPAGALLFGTKRADLNKIDGYAQITGTTENGENLQGAISIPLIPGKIAVRVAGLYDENDVSGVTTINGRTSSSHTYSGRLSITLQPVENWTTEIMFQYLDSKSNPYVVAFGPGNTVGGTATGPALSISDRKSVIEGPLNFENESKLLTVNSTYDLGGVEVVANIGIQRSLLSQLRDQDIGNAIPGFSRIQDLSTSFDYDQFELRLQSNNDSRFSWSIAGDYKNNLNYVPLHTDQHSFTPAGAVVPTCIAALGNACYERASVELTIKSKGWGLGGTIGYELTDAIKITGGLRYTDQETTRDQFAVINPITGGGFPLGAFTDPTFSTYPNGDWQVFLPLCTTFGPGSPFFQLINHYTFNPVGTAPFISVDPAGVCGLPSASHIVSKNKLWSGGANISWEVNPDLTAYASYGRTQRAGPPAVAVTATVGPQYLQAKNETADGFELGFKAYLLDRKMTLNAALFYQKFKNFLSYEAALFAVQPGGAVTTLAIPTNGDADLRGLELQVGYHPTRDSDFGLNASYVKSKYTSPVFCNVTDANGNPVLPPTPVAVGANVPQTATCQGRPLADSPKFTLTANGEVRFPTNAGVEPFVRGNLNFRPAFNSTISNYHYAADTKIDMVVGVRSDDKKWEVSAFAKNLLDQARVRAVSQSTYRTQATNGTFIDSGYRTGAVNAPREFGLTGKLNF